MKLGLTALILFMGACAVQPVIENRYRQERNQPATTDKVISELHAQTADALLSNRPGEALELLQRAIRIDPRNALSWHYLAQSYRLSGNPQICR